MTKRTKRTMTKRTKRTTSSKNFRTQADTDTSSVNALEQRVIAVAEQLGRIAGSAQAKTDGWLDQPTFRDQLARIRDGAAELVEQFTARATQGRSASQRKPAPKGRSGGKVDAPGKKHRTAPSPVHGVKHSDEKISKANAARQMKRGRQRQG